MANKKSSTNTKSNSVNQNVLSRIESEKIKPDSEAEVVGRRLLPVLAAGVLAVFSGLVVYSVLRMLTFYGNFGSNESGGILLSLGLLFVTLLGIGLCAVAISRSDWGYRYRAGGVIAVALAVTLAFGLVFTQGPVERFLDDIGVTSRFRLDERMLNESAAYGKIIEVSNDSLRVEIMGGGSLRVKREKNARIYPRGFKLDKGQIVAVLIDDRGVAKWIRILPENHPAGRGLQNDFLR